MSDFLSQGPATQEGQSTQWQGGAPAYSGRGSGPRAGFWRRFGATLVDGVLFLVVYALLALVLDATLAYAIALVAYYVYFTVMEGGPSGQTVGKKVAGVRVIDFRAGGPIGYGRGFLRNIAKILSGAVLYLGYLWMLWDREKQTWHDKLANTVVVPASAYPVG